ncbi:arylsulfatase [Thalassotalea sp. LPB0316]|uniref:arylsulfatase n=1 Tax=Thalassotalea sp. LPB0316 TaxID=2769490 RepID=UPI001868C270|nr:arylsulfatase [Thalassotalea sp. LPB0316]QOL24380.1 arylsulfatase [Thalassotalea sp. LPB0316]
MSFSSALSKVAMAFGVVSVSMSAMATTNPDKPNILAIWGDDIGIYNISAYNHGMMGYQTPNIDRLANEGALFTDHYAQQSCTAGRASFILGQEPFRTGLMTIGMPGSSHGIPDWAPTLGDVAKHNGYMTGQFGKNHLGDQDEHLPTKHGFDEFFGNLYHLNAEEEPETYYYPQDPEFAQKYGPRGVLHAYADGRVEDTGPLTRKRMETADEEFLAATLKFIDKAHKADKPFFIWYNSTRMHIHTRLQEKWKGKSGVSIYADGMLEHDEHIGVLLDKLDELKIADNTIVIYTTDNGAETFTWPDGGNTPFHGEKGTTYEGGMRVPQLVRWPGTIKPGTKENAMMSHLDWMPTLAAAMGDKNLVDDLKVGRKVNDKKWRVHLDGHNFKPYFEGKEETSPRDTLMYFSQTGQLNAIRWNDWKASFALVKGDMASGVREVPAWPQLVNLRADPFEKAPVESAMYVRWMIDNMWAFVPVSNKVQEFMDSLQGYPMQSGKSFGAADIDYTTLQMQAFVDKVQTELKK